MKLSFCTHCRSWMRWTVGIFVCLLLLVVVVVVVFFVITYFAPKLVQRSNFIVPGRWGSFVGFNASLLCSETSAPVAVRHNSNLGLTFNFGWEITPVAMYQHCRLRAVTLTQQCDVDAVVYLGFIRHWQWLVMWELLSVSAFCSTNLEFV